MPQPDPSQVVDAVLDWYDEHARDLPWRRPSRTPWGVMVSEFMLQQTPVARVLQPWQVWMERWPTPEALASEPSSSAVAAWGRLGYPRRALRLHQAAVAMVERHDGQVPSSLDDLRALPGVGDYTAAAVASFAFGQRQVVLDTNVRRVLARVASGREYPDSSPTRAERDLAESHLPADEARAARWSVASMELGALVCTARSPRCGECPVVGKCAWLAAGRPRHADDPTARPRRGQAWEGTDRQCRGTLLQALRDGVGGWSTEELLALWPRDRDQAERSLKGLLDDGLAHESDGVVTL
ncbi:HhH-GPD family protein [Aestuariimicrobium ganziense]|uniref:A/G-specific adenine glycosylase n=1 Tax=Aestuariimicrobium ganziense TaxID=2773677 RepID=UPI0019445988|nr:A/G-specific adenine glycosylase [Aestuariimicrobium ganziense]